MQRVFYGRCCCFCLLAACSLEVSSFSHRLPSVKGELDGFFIFLLDADFKRDRVRQGDHPQNR